MLTGHWDALAQALRALPALARFVPQSGPELAATTLTLLAALKRGSVADWLGHDQAHALPAALLSRLGEDFARMARLAEADPAAWRFVPLPLLRKDELEQVLLFVRGGHRDNGSAEDSGTRLLVEIEHTRLGRIQIDALVRPHRFDLIVRSHTELPLTLRQRLADIHSEARNLAGLAGTIGFQWAGAFVAPPLAAEHLGLTA